MSRLLVVLISIAVLLLSGETFAKVREAELEAGHISSEESRPVIDGVVDDPVWGGVGPYDEFTQQNPYEGQPATERTEVRVLLDGKTLFVGIIAFDSEPEAILVTESRRDGNLNDTDSVQILLDTFNDNQNAFVFGTNPVGLEYDGQVAGEGQTGGFVRRSGGSGSQRGQVSGFNANWDGDWSVAARITDRGWEAEIAIPLKTLRYNPGEDQTWGFNVMRNIRRKNEQVYLSPVPRGYSLYRVSSAASLTGLDLAKRRDVKVTPFGAGKIDQNNLAPTDQTLNNLDVGVDVKWGVTPSLTTDFTVNTDFAQVEADEEQINLTRFPLFFPEKRPFFLENASTFQFGAPQEVDLFFSRRIGLDPSGLPVGIVAGARATGKMGAFNLGILDMQTEETFTPRTGTFVAPANNFFVARVQREVGRSNYGAVVVNREATSSEPGIDRFNRAYGVDANVQVSQNTKLFTFLAGSTSPGEKGSDYAGRAFLNYANNKWNGHIGYTEVGERFDAQVGFVPRRGYRKPQARFFLDYQPKQYEWIRRFTPHVTWNAFYGFDGAIQTSHGHYHFFEVQMKQGGRFGVALDRDQDQPTEPFTIFSGPRGERVVVQPGLYTWYLWRPSFVSNPSAPVFFTYRQDIGSFYDGDLNRLRLELGFRRGAKLEARVGWTRENVSLSGGDFTTNLVPIRVTYSFTTLASLSALVQYNSTTASVSSNIRLALLNRSGTGFFAVYNDQRNTLSTDRFANTEMMARPSVLGRSFIIKYTYLFDF